MLGSKIFIFLTNNCFGVPLGSRIKYVRYSGFYHCREFFSPSELERCLSKMSATISHRGPDDGGLWSDAQAGVWLGHRRLSIVDLSPAGHQPMQSASGRYTIAFNGEIYNHKSLRVEMENAGQAPNWCGRSDTETLLHGFDLWGIQKTIEKLAACLPSPYGTGKAIL